MPRSNPNPADQRVPNVPRDVDDELETADDDEDEDFEDDEDFDAESEPDEDVTDEE